MKKKMKNIVKKSKVIYRGYSFIGKQFIKILKKYVKADDKLILFVSFGGKKFDDSPKAIYDMMKTDDRYKTYKLVWAFEEPGKFEVTAKIKIDTLKYYITALKARVWVTNSAIERGLTFKGINTLYFNTWHGTPIKKMGIDLETSNKSFNISHKQSNNIDIMTSQSHYEADILSRVFNIERSKFLICGLPRNDQLKQVSKDVKMTIMEKLGVPLDKKIVLYAPTFREYQNKKKIGNVIKPPIDFNKWEEKIGGEFVVLFRAHYEVVKILGFSEDNKFVYDVSDYPSLNDLMIVSDLLISDYSSIFFDYSILDKPMLCYTYDYDEYAEKRGMYFDIRDYIPGGTINEDKLLEKIQDFSNKEIMKFVKEFRKQFIEKSGNATKESLEVIYKRIS